jgi:hypothetical protein
MSEKNEEQNIIANESDHSDDSNKNKNNQPPLPTKEEDYT